MSKNYRHIWSEKRSLINAESHIRHYIEQRDILGSTHNHSFIYARNGIVEELHRDIDNQKWVALGKKFFKKAFVRELLKDGLKLRNDFKTFIAKFKKTDFTGLSDNKLINLFIKSYKYHSRLRGLFKTSRGEFLSIAEDKLKALLYQKAKDIKEIRKIFEILTTPNKFDEVNWEFIDWVRLLSKKVKNKKRILREHIYKYPWIIANSYDEEQIFKFLLQKYSRDVRKITALRKQVRELRSTKHRLITKQKKLLTKFQSRDINYLSWLFQELSLERMRLKGGWAGSDFLYLQLYKEIARRSKVTLKDFYSVYRIPEVIESIKRHNPVLTNKEKKKRESAYVLWLRNGNLSFYSGKLATRIIKREIKNIKKKQRNNEIRGQVASAGKAIGKVRVVIPGDIVLLTKAFQLVKSGDILVTTMTQPNMVPIMKKVSAVVTDEGGLTSHAAILAREFKIPCIVGTEVGTKIFKDGDKIEVDATRGIVKKIG